MATAFQKGNRRATASAEKASAYIPNAITQTNGVSSTNVATFQLVVPWQFKGNGQVEVTLPFGFTLPNGVYLGQPSLIANASGSYAAGFHPIVQFSMAAASSANINVSPTDLFVVQY